MRFSELREATGANPSTLARVLDDLEADSLIERRIEEDAPVATYYGLTEKGVALQPTLRSLSEWAKEWLR